MHRVSAYLLEVESALDRIADGSALASVLDHCMYCGMSLGRVGLDFRGLLPSIFQKRIHAIVASAVRARPLCPHVPFAHSTRLPRFVVYGWAGWRACSAANRRRVRTAVMQAAVSSNLSGILCLSKKFGCQPHSRGSASIGRAMRCTVRRP